MRHNSRFLLWAMLISALLVLPARANTWPLPPSGSRVVGENRYCRLTLALTPTFRVPEAY